MIEIMTAICGTALSAIGLYAFYIKEFALGTLITIASFLLFHHIV